MRALVTGAGGFIGKRVTAALRKAGIEVTELGSDPAKVSDSARARRFALGPAPWPARALERVLRDVQPDLLFHLAGVRDGPPELVREINFGLCLSLLRALCETRLRPVVVASGSAAEYGAALVDGGPTEESRPCRPTGVYGAAKLAQTEALGAFARETGARCVAARLFNPIGAGMPVHLALGGFARQIDACADRGDELVVGDIEVARDFMPVEVAAEILVGLALHPSARDVVNVCSGAPVKLRRLVDAMIARSGKNIAIRVDPARLRPGEPRVVFGGTRRLTSFGLSADGGDIAEAAAALVRRPVPLGVA